MRYRILSFFSVLENFLGVNFNNEVIWNVMGYVVFEVIKDGKDKKEEDKK